jgi:hypothetical protein
MMRAPAVRFVSMVLLAANLSSCTSWQVQSVPPQQTLSDPAALKKGVRITTQDRFRVIFHQPKLVGDTVLGFFGNPKKSPGQSVAIPLGQIQQLELKRPDYLKTFGLVVGSLAAAGAITIAILCIGYCGAD